MPEVPLKRLQKYEIRLFIVLALTLLCVLVISLTKGLEIGGEGSTIAFVLVDLVELALPAALCVLAALQLRRGKRRWLSVVALCVCGLLVAGFCMAPFLMLGTGTLKNVMGAVAVFSISAFTASVYLALLIIKYTVWLKRQA